ncbi:unnamed protein product [Leuciscus chuanchicus]
MARLNRASSGVQCALVTARFRVDCGSVGKLTAAASGPIDSDRNRPVSKQASGTSAAEGSGPTGKSPAESRGGQYLEKESWWWNEELYRDIEENGPKKIYKLAKTRQRRAKDIDRLNLVKDQEGKIICEDVKIKERWREYFSTLLNTKNNRKELPQTDPVQGPIENITDVEVRLQLEKMAANKARGPD